MKAEFAMKMYYYFMIILYIIINIDLEFVKDFVKDYCYTKIIQVYSGYWGDILSFLLSTLNFQDLLQDYFMLDKI